MKEFKIEFQPALMKGGSIRINEGFGRKHYVAGFVMGKHPVHQSKVQHKTATQASVYAQAVLERYKKMMQAAFMAFVESQNVQSVG